MGISTPKALAGQSKKRAWERLPAAIEFAYAPKSRLEAAWTKHYLMQRFDGLPAEHALCIYRRHMPERKPQAFTVNV
ncbi:MAG: hypothetical protein AB8G18_11255 [Gammaproteobacteria bacterium]